MIDRRFVREAILCDEQFKQTHLDMAREVTGLDNPNSPVQLKEWLSEHGVEADSLSKAAVMELLEQADGEVELALSLRKELAKSSVKKYREQQDLYDIHARHGTLCEPHPDIVDEIVQRAFVLVHVAVEYVAAQHTSGHRYKTVNISDVMK